MNEIFKKIKEIKLSAQEKRAIFNKIDAFVRENPLNDSLKSMPLDSLKSMPVPHGIVSPWRQFYSLQYRHAFSFVIAIIMVLGGGASFVAADALPGDLLYPVKIGLNEKITPIFLNDIKKAIYSANLVGKRLKEATALISSDTLNDKKARILNEEIEKRASDVISEVKQASDRGEYEKALEISNSLTKTLQEKVPAESDLIDKNVKDDLRALAEVREKADDAVQKAIAGKEIDEDQAKMLVKKKRESVVSVVGDVSGEVFATSTKEINKETEKESQKKPDDKYKDSESKAASFSVVEDKSEKKPPNPKELLKQGDNAFSARDYAGAFKLYREAEKATGIDSKSKK